MWLFDAFHGFNGGEGERERGAHVNSLSESCACDRLGCGQ